MPPQPLRQHLGHLNWLLNPRHGLDASGIYDLLSTGSPTEHGLYLNLGYWRDASTIDEASDALATLAAESGQMGARDTVLDCGFGFGDQDILWAQTLQPKRIIGLNITESQVAIARRRIAEAGLQEQVDLRHGSATEMPIAANSVDLVVALESAFHFRTRERFFREAWRVLRPGGRLVTADIVPMPAVRQRSARLKQRVSWGLVASKFAIPDQNVYTLPGYRSLLERCGFQAIAVESIRDQVYAPLHRYLVRHPERLLRLHPMIRLVTKVALRSEPASVYAGLDYLLSRSEKPSESCA
jgi:ubiquinone/menaquinone biosynthesis C-methylase UbiE